MVQKSGVHQLRLVVYPGINSALYIPGGWLGFLNHQQYLPSFLKWVLDFFTAQHIMGLDLRSSSDPTRGEKSQKQQQQKPPQGF